jgi:putative ABC transport system substrate-binding protein
MVNIMKNILQATTLLTLLTLSSQSFADKKVCILIPMTHEAMTEITNGFESSLSNEYKQPLQFKVANAQGDANLERASLQSLRDSGCDIIAPVGTSASQMAISMVKNIPIVSLASDISDNDRQKLNPCNIAVVHDEISNEQQLAFIHATYPNLKEITLFHSADDKVFPEVKDAVEAGKKFGITIKPIMATTLPDLQTVSQNLPTGTQGIFVLKDSLIVSGIAQLAKIAAQRHIPLISSDDGSVQNGAGFALGVHEKQIGSEGALLAAQILNGKKACDLPIAEMRKLTVFLNPISMQKMGTSLEAVKQSATKMGYPVEIM